jgi:hypothetical protein
MEIADAERQFLYEGPAEVDDSDMDQDLPAPVSFRVKARATQRAEAKTSKAKKKESKGVIRRMSSYAWNGEVYKVRAALTVYGWVGVKGRGLGFISYDRVWDFKFEGPLCVTSTCQLTTLAMGLSSGQL